MNADCVYHALKNASSQDIELLNQSTQLLKSWETEPGFYSILAQLCTQTEIGVDIRLMSVLYLKNCVDRYWRNTTQHAINESEKQLIRDGLMKHINYLEVENRLGSMVSLVVAKIGRLDWPKNWPDLIPELYKREAWRTLYQVVKCLASKRLGPSRKLFQQMTSEVLPTLHSLWEQQLNLSNSQMSNQIHDLIFLTKIIRCLLIEGVAPDEQDRGKLNQVTQIIDRCLSTASLLILKQSTHSQNTTTQCSPARNKLIKTCLKCVTEFQSKHAKFIKTFMKQIFVSSTHLLLGCSSDEDRVNRQQILLLINKILYSSEFNAYKNSEEGTELLSLVLSDGQNLLEGLLVRLIYVEFQLDLNSEAALQSTTNNALMYEALDEETKLEATGLEVKMAERSLEQLAGSCLKGLVNLWPGLILPKTVLILQKFLSEGIVSQQESAVRLCTCLLKELSRASEQSVNTDISLDNLVSNLSNQFLSQPIVNDALNSQQYWASLLLQIRVLSLLYEWIIVTYYQIPISERDQVQSPRVVFCFNVLSSVVAWSGGPSSLPVRLHACRIFSQVLDYASTVKLNSALDFEKLSNLIKNVLSLMTECRDSEMQLKLLKTLKHFVLLCDDPTFSLYTPLLEIMPALWNLGKEEALFQNLILDYLTIITRHLTNPQYLQSMVPLVVKFLNDALNDQQDENTRDCLAENCFLLVQTLLNSLPDYPTNMNPVVPFIGSTLIQCPEYVMEFILAVESLLYHGVDMPDSSPFFDLLISSLIPALLKAIPQQGSSHQNYQYLSSASSVSPSKVRLTIFDLLEEFLITCPTNCIKNSSFTPVLVSIISYLTLQAPVEPDQDREPLFTHIQLIVLARILFIDSSCVSQTLSDLSLSCAGDGSESTNEKSFFLAVDHLVYLWLARLDHQATLLHRKLCALAPLHLLTLSNPLVEKHFDSVINACLQIIQEEEELQKQSNSADSPTLSPDGPENLIISPENDQPGQIRGKLAKQRDFCRRNPLLNLMKSCLQNIEQNVGAGMMSVLVQDLDPVIRNQLMNILAQ